LQGAERAPRSPSIAPEALFGLAEPFGRTGVKEAHPIGQRAEHQDTQMIMNKTKKPTLPVGSTAKLYLAGAALALTLLVVPQIGHAQGIVRGAQQGAYEGDRVAGPIGGVVGGAVGAGVGGAVGAVDGVLGIPYRHGCRGFYGRYDRFHCYR